MKTLDTKEWVAVVVAVFVVGFFFIFGQNLISYFNNNTQLSSGTTSGPQVLIQDNTIGVGDLAETGDRVTVQYVGRLVDGTVFDSSVARNEPFQFVIGSNQIIEGWNKGIAGMRVGGKRTISIPPELGYGAIANGPIPANSTLIFDIELLKVEK